MLEELHCFNRSQNDGEGRGMINSLFLVLAVVAAQLCPGMSCWCHLFAFIDLTAEASKD